MTDLQTCDEALFWYFISERHFVYLERAAGRPKPWTADPILQQYKFVNVFRKLDRTTDWLIKNFLTPHLNGNMHELAFNIAWFRMFNRWETGELLGWQTYWDPDEILKKLRSAEFPVFTGAYIIHSEFGIPKDESIVEVCNDLFMLIHKATIYANDSTISAEHTSKMLQKVRHVGPFMAYQMVLDMMYTPLLCNAKDKETWTCTGPGALRGLKRLDPSTTMKDSLQRMLDLQNRSGEKLRDMGATHVPPLNVHDIEFCLCELDKYCRVKFGEGRPRSKYPGV